MINRVLKGVPVHTTVARALRSAASTAHTKAVGTRDLLVALMRTDARAEWHRLWLHCGDDEAIAAMPYRDMPSAAAGLWETVVLTEACATALEVAARLAERYAMGPLPPGGLALGLVADETCAASRALGQGLGRIELLDLLQRAILGTTLSGLPTVLPQLLDDARRGRNSQQDQSAPGVQPPASATAPMGPRHSGSPSSTNHPMTCPSHGTQEMVRAVPAVYSEGTVRTDAWGPVVGIAGGHLAMGVSRSRGTAQTYLAQQLNPRPHLRSILPIGCVALLYSVSGVLLIVYGLQPTSQFDNGTGTLGPGVVVLASSAVPWIRVIIRWYRRNKVERGLARALAVWNIGLYCGLCHGVFFAPGTEPPDVAPGALLAPPGFQQVVWAAGGYGRQGRAAVSRRRHQ